ncbi:hypothetical protein like AT1G65560 [Hibiscus trionum]|uniref:Enoyl reductase (ER) domain-containing protein n=1 Tax=Hibiscus trionum TaxID=183268 RepID=A0A9W7GSD6_HIBTR|nr:hypothetical protein like AT1G65560 [Hibiscus trionum]
MATAENKQVVLERYIEEQPKETDMAIKMGKMELKASKGSGSFLVKNLYLSCDPYMRGRMRDFHGSYIPPFLLSQPIEGFGVAKVLDSDNPDFKPGDFISGFTGWEQYSLIRNTWQLRKIQQHHSLPLSYHLGLLGMPGFTAYVGFYEICSPKKGEYVFVSAASGAVGQLVGQLAKLHGCYVVGSAGSSQKVDLLKNKLGYDEAFNYKEETDLDAALKRYFPEGIDIYFDNVGGAILDAALLNMRIHGRIAVCGMVSLHSISDPKGIQNLFCVVPKRIKMQGFLQSDYLDKFPQFVEHVTENFKLGKIVYIEDMNEGLETAPAAFAGLFSGKNIGKQVICVARD